MQILLINGPNLNMLGKREPDVYGHITLQNIEEQLGEFATARKVNLISFQSNAECALIDKIHASAGNTSGIIFNPAAFTHTSVALRDAILSVNIPFIEVHISNVHKRESFRQHSYFADIAIGSIVGLGVSGYKYALDAIIEYIQQQ